MNEIAELECAKTVAFEAGQILKSMFGKIVEYKQKNDASLVSQADLESEQFIIKQLKSRFPQYRISSEESGLENQSEYAGTWHVDPLDGTHNYLHQIPQYGVCLSLEKNNQLICGVVCIPEENNLYYAAPGVGAFCNEHIISVSKRNDAKAFLNYEGRLKSDAEWATFKRLYNLFDLRIVYSTAYSLTALASGKIDACYSEVDQYFDYSAAGLIITEAGGKITNIDGSPLDKSRGFVASNGILHEQLIDSIQRTKD